MISAVEAALGVAVQNACTAHGGCISEARLLNLDDGRFAFAKAAAGGQAPFPAEASGLKALHAAAGVRVPEVWYADETLLILEGIENISPCSGYMETFGRQLAQTHRTASDHYGFPVDHVIGATPQKNQPMLPSGNGVWAEFWWDYRIEPMIHHVDVSIGLSAFLRKALKRLEPRIPGLVDGTGDTPCLLHGDLWAGNTMPDEQGRPVIFDPAAYYGHREADLAMTQMFGGFSCTFYESYNEAFPLADGWRERLDLYMLYHVLNHIALFGRSYTSQAEQLVRRYL